MWMMGCNDVGGDQLRSVQDSFNGRKLRPLMPITAAARNSQFLALNHHFEENKRDGELMVSRQQVVVSSRWNPTPEQLETLEELYRRGVRTPSADQIHHITTQLRRYGKIEGKNVFYWFQNHKARERQKRRRQLHHDDDDDDNHMIIPISEIMNKKQSSSSGGQNGTLLQTWNNKLASPQKSTTKIQQKSMPTRGAEGSKADGWVHFNEKTEVEERRYPSNWQMLHLSSSSSSSPSPISPNNPIYYSFSNSSATQYVDTNYPSRPTLDQQCYGGAAGCVEEQTTLQLFPVRSDDDDDDDRSIVVNYDTTTSTNVVAPDHYQFFEFLPLKK